jgi:hypothetical protein
MNVTAVRCHSMRVPVPPRGLRSAEREAIRDLLRQGGMEVVDDFLSGATVVEECENCPTIGMLLGPERARRDRWTIGAELAADDSIPTFLRLRAREGHYLWLDVFRLDGMAVRGSLGNLARVDAWIDRDQCHQLRSILPPRALSPWERDILSRLLSRSDGREDERHLHLQIPNTRVIEECDGCLTRLLSVERQSVSAGTRCTGVVETEGLQEADQGRAVHASLFQRDGYLFHLQVTAEDGDVLMEGEVRPADIRLV